MRKLRAFTILEVLVAMVISTIVIGGSFLAYEMTYKQYKQYSSVSSRTNEALAFYSVLGKDMSGSEAVRMTDKGIVCLTKKEKISYDFSNQYILRRLEFAVDTFRVKNENVLLSCRKLEQKGIGSLVDHITFRINLDGEKQDVIMRKQYGADGIMNELLTAETNYGRH